MKLKQMTVLLALLVASISVATGPALAQDNTTVEEPKNETTYAMVVPGDPDTRVVSFDYSNGVMQLVIEKETPGPVTLTAAPEATGTKTTGTGYVQTDVLPDGRSKVSVRSPNGVVWISTRQSIQSGKFGYLRASTSSFPIPGPWDSTDARNAGIGGALGTAAVAVVLAWKRRYSDENGGERIA